MNDEQIALARHAVACDHWRWMPGIRLECGDILLWSDDHHWHCAGGQNWTRWRHERIGQADRGSLPDLTDPGTLGCLLALVREAWGDPDAHPALGAAGWVLMSGESRVADVVYPSPAGRTEAEALVAALEAAPRSTKKEGT